MILILLRIRFGHGWKASWDEKILTLEELTCDAEVFISALRTISVQNTKSQWQSIYKQKVGVDDIWIFMDIPNRGI